MPATPRRVVAVGTTAVRALESAAATGEPEGRTRLFIHRGYDWQVVDVLMTNFHLPRTTLLMMIDAFVGPRWRRLYDVALDDGYRFLSFGDAMLLDTPRHAVSMHSASSIRGHRSRRRGPHRRRPHRPRHVPHARASCRSAPAARSST